ncbi:flagellar rod assembly protein/muramidase FlgJ [Halothiobacillus diazotrophicus]|uniref:Peptidoglycan hydrolase FlgJ n=1 Tax=Halothiobacillus diazotrophicus TaxID=1860122 RepID=A0A191ZJT5_9GAMM|nr:flagellar assembly peptidoglycan hydrolase FlgJ [Halothiobacillus diazotrophicus]ANJ68112.1 flagellar rod assembly protein/muramidase FlgJ [Halothiobacillus diazotrophicus]
MTINQSTAITSYNDFEGLARLQSVAKNDPRAALKTVAHQFETQFINMMMKSMRDATPQNGLLDSEQSKTFQSMMDQEVSQKIAAHGGIGLARMIEQQLRQDTSSQAAIPQGMAFPLHNASIASSQPVDAPPRAFKLPPRDMTLRPFALHRPPTGPEATASGDTAPGSGGTSVNPISTAQTPKYWDSPEAFVDAIMPHAQAAARKLGVPAKVLVAQSALETGWGKHLPVDAQGRQNYNFFGIKADPSWQGAQQTVNTLEFEGGAMVTRKAAFRAYDSIASSFNDFVQFLQENPRYSQALSSKGDPDAFARALQKAGYATDPQYADKLIAIMHSGRIPDATSESAAS